MQNTKWSSISFILLFIFLGSITSIVEAREFKAKLTWFNVTTLSFRVNGNVTALHVKPGDYVKIKQKLVTLDQREYLDNVSLTKSLQKSRKSELNEAKRELDRALELFDRTVLSEHELQTIKNNFIASESNYITAKLNWLKAKRNLEFSSVVAPFNAVILDTIVNENETVISTLKHSPVIIIAEADKMSAQFMLSAEDIATIEMGKVVEVEIDGTSYKGKLFFPSLLPINSFYPIAVELEMPYGKYHTDMAVTVKTK